MRFNPRARLDRSQIDTGGGGGGRGGFPGLPGGGGGMKVGGGVGLVIAVVLVLMGVISPADILGSGVTGPGSSQPGQSQQQGAYAKCRSGADANSNAECQLVGIANSVNSFWASQFPQETGKQYQVAQTHPFNGVVDTQGCGQATSDVGPFYCPNDSEVYLDLSFFQDMLQGQLGGQDAPFTRAYVVAHEYGHHIENLLGVMGRVRTQQGANSDSVKLELMADCLAGAWAKHAQEAKDEQGNTFIQGLTQRDISDAINAAQTVGDDRIQQRTSGRIDPDAWTHGSAAQREQAFNHGLQNGTIRACTLF